MGQNIPRVKLFPPSVKGSKLFSQNPQCVRATRALLGLSALPGPQPRCPCQPPGASSPCPSSATEPFCQPTSRPSLRLGCPRAGLPPQCPAPSLYGCAEPKQMWFCLFLDAAFRKTESCGSARSQQLGKGFCS